MSVAKLEKIAADELLPIRRVVIENVRPQIEGGRFVIKRVVGESVEVTADVHADGHNVLSALLLDRPAGRKEWRETEMESLGNDGWRASFRVDALEPYVYTVCAWIDTFFSWLHDLEHKVEAGQDVSVDLLVGAGLLESAAKRASLHLPRKAPTDWRNVLTGETLSLSTTAGVRTLRLGAVFRRFPVALLTSP